MPDSPLAYESPQTALSGIGIGTIALQLVGVYCIAHALAILSMMAPWIGASSYSIFGAQVLATLIATAVYAGIAVLLIRFASRISIWLFRDHSGGIMAGPVTAPVGQYLQAIAFSVAGVLTIVGAAPRLASLIWMALSDMGSQFDGYPVMVEPIAQILLGVALFLQSKGLSLLWHKIRTGGVIGTQPAQAHEPVHSESEQA